MIFQSLIGVFAILGIIIVGFAYADDIKEPIPPTPEGIDEKGDIDIEEIPPEPEPVTPEEPDEGAVNADPNEIDRTKEYDGVQVGTGHGTKLKWSNEDIDLFRATGTIHEKTRVYGTIIIVQKSIDTKEEVLPCIVRIHLSENMMYDIAFYVKVIRIDGLLSGWEKVCQGTNIEKSQEITVMVHKDGLILWKVENIAIKKK